MLHQWIQKNTLKVALVAFVVQVVLIVLASFPGLPDLFVQAAGILSASIAIFVTVCIVVLVIQSVSYRRRTDKYAADEKALAQAELELEGYLSWLFTDPSNRKWLLIHTARVISDGPMRGVYADSMSARAERVAFYQTLVLPGRVKTP